MGMWHEEEGPVRKRDLASVHVLVIGNWTFCAARHDSKTSQQSLPTQCPVCGTPTLSIMEQLQRPRHQLKILSANVRNLRTNIGDLTHNRVLRHSVNIVVVTETWLNSEVESTFGKIPGYVHWARRDRHEKAGDGVAVCFKERVQAQHVVGGDLFPGGVG